VNKLFKTIVKITAISLIVVLIITNPRSNQYEEYASQQLMTYLKNDLCVQIADSLKSPCYILVNTASPQIQTTVSRNTKKTNFILFSVYNTELKIPPIISNYSFTTLGIFERFFTYQTETDG
jgi:hypothetical protein